MVKVWGSAPAGQFTCPHCGSLYEQENHRLSERDKDTAECQVCHETMAEWNSTTFPVFRLIKAVERPSEEGNG